MSRAVRVINEKARGRRIVYVYAATVIALFAAMFILGYVQHSG